MNALWKRIIAGWAVLCLLLPVSAAGGTGVTLRARETGGGARLSLEGLDREACALQLTLTLEGEQRVRFTPDPEDVYCPECRVDTDRSGTRVTIYMVSETGSLEDGSLGTLTFQGRLPAEAELLLLDRSSSPIGGGPFRVSLSSGGADTGQYRVHIARPDHGAVTVRPTGADEGETVTLNVLPDAGYVLDAITARDSRDREVPLTRDGLNRYTFPMPALDVEVSASFVPGGGGPVFRDVRPGDACYEAVRYVYEAGLMNGTTADTFTPDASITRGQIVAILYRLEGSPAAGTSRFQDVAPGAYYASAVTWASENGIVNGYQDNTFRPNQPITREQMAAFLYRYAVQKGRDVSQLADLSVFSDAGQIASYAVTPLRWASAAGLINGVSADTLAPGRNASRAQAAMILSRFVQNVL